MIVYRGLGFLALICYVGAGVLIASLLNWGFGIDILMTKAWWPLHLTFVFGAAVTFIVGFYLNRQPVEEMIYEKSGPVSVLKPRHTLYFIRMEYWGPIILAIYLFACFGYQFK